MIFMATASKVKDFRFTPQETSDLFSKQATVDRREVLTEKVGKRAEYIVQKIADIVGSKLNWFDFYDEDANSEQDSTRFNHDQYKRAKTIFFTVNAKPNKYKDVDIDDEFLIEKEPDFAWSVPDSTLSFPVRWLHEDFEPVLQKAFDETRAEHQEQNALAKKIASTVVSVKSKAKAGKLKR